MILLFKNVLRILLMTKLRGIIVVFFMHLANDYKMFVWNIVNTNPRVSKLVSF